MEETKEKNIESWEEGKKTKKKIRGENQEIKYELEGLREKELKEGK
jgi:hypothetical protein